MRGFGAGRFRYPALFVAIVAAFALLVPGWRIVDLWALATMLDGGPPHAVDSQVVPIDLGARLGRLRPELLETLDAICGSDERRFSCNRPALQLPGVIVIDIEFFAKGGDPQLIAPLSRTIGALFNRGVAIYGSILPYDQPGVTSVRDTEGAPVEAIYQHFTGTGHTQLFTLPVFSSVAWYEPTISLDTGQEVQALPISLQEGISGHADLAARDEQTRVFSIGSHRAFLDVLRSAPLDPSKVSFGKYDWVVIGDVAAEYATLAKHPEVKLADGRTGFELVTWAVSNLKANLVRRQAATLDSTWFLVPMIALFSLIAASVYRLVFARLRTKRYCYATSFALTLAATLGVLAILTGALYASGTVFARLSLVIVGVVTATALATRQAMDEEKHLRFLTSLGAKAKIAAGDARRYDVFVSYAHGGENAAWVEKNVVMPLAELSGPDGAPLRIFFDRESLHVGMQWYERIAEAVHTSRFFLPVYSKSYFRRWFCRDEIELAMLQLEERPDFMIPVSRVGPKIPRRYQSVQYIDAVRDPKFAAKIVKVVTTP